MACRPSIYASCAAPAQRRKLVQLSTGFLPALVEWAPPAEHGASVCAARAESLLVLLCVQGLVQSAFLWGYMATPLLGGVLADKYGGAPAHAAHATRVSAPP